jgi:hypothetical protein
VRAPPIAPTSGARIAVPITSSASNARKPVLCKSLGTIERKASSQGSGPRVANESLEGRALGAWGAIPLALDVGPAVGRSSGRGLRRRDVSRGAGRVQAARTGNSTSAET